MAKEKDESANAEATPEDGEKKRGKKAKTPGKRRAHTIPKKERDKSALDYSYTQNRELSWLGFDNRVLDEAFDETVPLFERLKFVSIFGSNLDEWFMVRIGGLSDLARLKKQPTDNKSGDTPSEQVEKAMAALPALIDRQGEAFHAITGELAKNGLALVRSQDLTDADLATIAKFFDSQVAPIISPLVVDPRHPFPNLRNGHLYVTCTLDGPDETGVLGMVEMPHSLPRVVQLPSTPRVWRYVMLEDVIISRLDSCFGGYVSSNPAVIRVTRNADIDPDGEGVEEEEDYRLHMKKVLKARLRLQPVRLEVAGTLDTPLEEFIASELDLTPNRIFHVNIPIDLGYVFSLEDKIPAHSRAQLLNKPFEPQSTPMVDPALPMREQVEDHDILLFYPYESMNPLLRLVREASADDRCISIKVTLYRVAKQSSLCESLIAAAENGKEVTVLMELRARFDEANNIAWAERLDAAGCTVIYGSEGFKCHSKILLITYHDAAGIRRITCLGTGNFNEKTAKLYSDFMLLTAHEGIGEDGNVFFRNLSLGNLHGNYTHLGVAPVGLKPLIMRGMDREIMRAKAGDPAQVFLKMNSLTDRDVIDKIAEASQAGVKVLLIVRGITCMKPGIEGKTDGVFVHQIVGRFLEHARVYAFGAESDVIYLSSADMMTRNTEHRVEIAYPVLDPACRALVIQYMNLQFADNVKARYLAEDGLWKHAEKAEGAPAINSQDLLMALAIMRANHEQAEGEGIRLGAAPPKGITAELPPEVVAEFSELPSTIARMHITTPSAEATGRFAAVTPQMAAAAKAAAPTVDEGALPEGAIEAEATSADTAVAPAPRSRFSRGLELLGRGLRLIFTGADDGEEV